ncbi:MAG TPA: hypothetical protein VKR42_00465 [Ktedonobacteraceae bacterium]|nr:hypothetical protein [Ktedonobacteraceae bacterium]
MRELGRIKQVQIQPSPLKVESSDVGYYDPTPLLVVESLELTPDGIFGITAKQKRVIDVHHIDHPTSGNLYGTNGVSFGFTSHYETMRTQFGEHMVDGCAGENILIETDALITLSDLGNRIVIQSEETGQFVYLTKFKVAAPCVEFSQFAANHGLPLDAAPLKATLQFLHQGRRGFYATAEAQEMPVLVKAGDRVFVVEEERE